MCIFFKKKIAFAGGKKETAYIFFPNIYTGIYLIPLSFARMECGVCNVSVGENAGYHWDV